MDKRHCARLAACAFVVVGDAFAQADGIYVTPIPTDEASIAQPASVLRGDELRRRQAGSIGDTLDREPGVQSGGMGPGASRPVIRGQDAPRVRVLENGIGSMDASSISPDHMPAVETLGATQVEVLRGPATLIHGGGAMGGLVNVVTKRIPQDKLEGFAGAAELRLGSAARGATGLVDLNGGKGGFAWHVDAFRRDDGDYRAARGIIRNSFIDSTGANLGASFIGDRGYVGIGIQQLSSFYGVPAGEQARIDLEQTRYDLAGELRDPFPGFAKARLRLGRNQYRHDEVEQTGEVATTFRNKAREGRLELTHQPLGAFKGVLGFSFHQRDFSAVGEESFLAPTKSSGHALFLVEEARSGEFRFELGGRVERERHRPQGLPARSFSPSTWSGAAGWEFSRGYSAVVTLTGAQRAPAIEELYANGPHAATATFEVGDAALNKESSINVDLSLRKTAGPWRWKAGVYANRFSDYIYAHVLGAVGPLTLVNYRQADARFHGFEAELAYKPETGFGGRIFADMARGKLEGVGNVPRMAPARVGAELSYKRGPWTAYSSLLQVFRQDRVAALESETPGYLRVDAGASYRSVFLQVNNLLDRDMRVHTSFIKDAAPLPGRSLMLGARLTF